MRLVRGAAWTVFLLDVVVLAQLGYTVLTVRSGPTAQALMTGFTMMLGAWLAGILVVLILSAWLHSRAGLWLALICGTIPLLWVLAALWQSMWE